MWWCRRCAPAICMPSSPAVDMPAAVRSLGQLVAGCSTPLIVVSSPGDEIVAVVEDGDAGRSKAPGTAPGAAGSPALHADRLHRPADRRAGSTAIRRAPTISRPCQIGFSIVAVAMMVVADEQHAGEATGRSTCSMPPRRRPRVGQGRGITPATTRVLADLPCATPPAGGGVRLVMTTSMAAAGYLLSLFTNEFITFGFGGGTFGVTFTASPTAFCAAPGWSASLN